MNIEGYINIYKTDNLLNVNGGIYNDQDIAIKAGKCVRGYIETIYINVTIPDKNE